MDENIKREWEEKIRTSFGDAGQLSKFMTETLENFAYRYISTAKDSTPRVVLTGETLTITTLEDSMVNALKISHSVAKEGIKELAKRVPKAQGPTVQYQLLCQIQKLKPDDGKLVLSARVSWDFPNHADRSARSEVSKTFTWNDLQIFRKGFPLAVQEVCDLFL